MEPKKIENKTIVIGFSNDKVPTFNEVRGHQYIKYGENNDYPSYLVNLFNRSAKHNAIITAKQLYIAGQGLDFNSQGLEPQQIVLPQAFLNSANSSESLFDVT